MACRALRHRLQRILPKDKLPAVPCIAVKNDMLINDPDFPEASDHFCTPLTIEESNNRLKVTFERGYKRARMKMAAESELKNSPSPMKSSASATCEIDEDTTNPLSIDQYLWPSATKSEPVDDSVPGSSGSSDKEKEADRCSDSATSGDTLFNGNNPSNHESDSEMVDVEETSPQSRLDQLLRLEEQRAEAERDKSTSPDENLNLNMQNFAQKLLDSPPAPFLPPTSLFGTGLLPTPAIDSLFSLQHLAAKLTRNGGSELLRALNSRQPCRSPPAPHVTEIINKYITNNWDLPENGAATSHFWISQCISLCDLS